MGLVNRVGRKRPRARFAMGMLYLILTAGAITTVYPFLLMLSTGFKGSTDQNDNQLIPEYWSNVAEMDEDGQLAKGSLLNKYLDDKYAGDATMIATTRTGEEATPDRIATYVKFLEELPLDYWNAGFRLASTQVTSRLNAEYQAWLREKYSNDINALNKAYIEENIDFRTVSPPAEMLERKVWKAKDTVKYREWLVFKRSLPAEFRVPIREQKLFQDYLKSKYQNQLANVPPIVVGEAENFDQITLPRGGPVLDDFYANWLPERYKNGASEATWATVSQEPMPIEAYERAFVASKASEIRREFAARNYTYVIEYIVINGRALWNTAIFCLLAIGSQLIINPLAAYALSRFPIKASAKILLFLLATMAFPAEVAMIPSFLMLKDFGMLNTFWALVLPGAASGYMIFLLKGFFDSLPSELFEAGQLDGAKETTMMMRIAIPLSRPVLGYLALIAFMGAYSSFMYAFLVAQDQRMWTLMVWIYQLQNVAPRAVVMAALTVAAIPTLVVFLAAQGVIMKGIVLPGER
ncbi:MAG: carbohydrate ABC transporter permease [Fimbriimonadaceae bacterium]|nr:carbohydrate ABC transporter permease [Fimbriimonadaceae bacterium]